MSLVNDMLRDLDQRRKESEGPAARIRLTPAGDYPRQEQRNWVPVIAVGLVVVAAGLGYTWMQMAGSTTTQDLASTVVPAAPIATPIEESSSPAAVVAPVVSIIQSAPVVPAVQEAVTSIAGTVVEELTLQDRITALAQPSPAISNIIATQQQNISRVPSETIQPEFAANSLSETRGPVITADIKNPTQAVPEQIKDSRAPSPEQRDTLVVQEALRLIADNQPTAAYARLEQNLIQNPYAHQSRETYAKFLMNQGDTRSASSLMDAGLELAPNHSGFKKVKARLLIAESDIQQAVTLLANRAPSAAEDLEYHEILASAQLASRDFDGAVLSYTSLVQQDQTQGKWWYGFAAAQDALGNVTAARQAYSRAIEKPNLSTNLRRRSQDRLSALGQ